MNNRRWALALGFDVVVVGVFVAIGRRSHDEGSAVRAVVTTAAPFLIGLAAAWLAVRAWRRPLAVLTGVVVWPITVLVGMVCRNLVFERGTATSFVIVATVFLGAGLVGWRAVARIVGNRRGRQNSIAATGTS